MIPSVTSLYTHSRLKDSICFLYVFLPGPRRRPRTIALCVISISNRMSCRQGRFSKIISSKKRLEPPRLREERRNDDDRIRHSFVLSSRNSNSAIFCPHRSGRSVQVEGCVPCKPFKTSQIEFSLFCDSLFVSVQFRRAKRNNAA